jgi:SAM-dependent methyltransferase
MGTRRDGRQFDGRSGLGHAVAECELLGGDTSDRSPRLQGAGRAVWRPWSSPNHCGGKWWTSMRKVLNVGGNNKTIPLPPQYAGWEHLLLDIDPLREPDVVCDARDLCNLPASTFDSVYCSHNLEHYYRHDVPKVLAGFAHVLKDDGFVMIRVPDMEELMRTVVEKNLDIDDFLYESPAGPITVRDVIYGLGTEIEESGQDFFAHKTGFTRKSLLSILATCGFPIAFSAVGQLQISAVAFTQKPSQYAVELFGFPVSP